MLFSESELNAELEKVIKKLQAYLKGLRTGRANAAMFEEIMVDYYGAQVELKSIANVIIENALSVLIQPYDRGAADSITEAIQNSNMGLSPINEGERIRINLPALTEEKRKETVNVMKDDLENNFRKRVRQIRQDFNQKIDKLEGVSEDEIKVARKTIQTKIDSTIADIEELAKKKEKDIMDI